MLTAAGITPQTMCNFGHYLRRIGFMANRENASRPGLDRPLNGPNTVYYIASGANNDVFNLTVQNVKLILKVGYYDWLTVNRIRQAHDQGATDLQKRAILLEDPLNAAFEFAEQVANYMVYNNISPHWVCTYRRNGHCYNVLKYIQQYVNLPPLPEVDGGDAGGDGFVDRERRKKLRADRSRRAKLNDLTLMEKFDIDLTEALAHKKFKEVWEVEQCLFEILFTLALVQHEFPGTTHNDLHCGNVFLKKVPEVLRKDEAGNVCLSRYRYNDDVWKRPVPRYFTAIGDFDFVKFQGRTRNVKVYSGVYSNFGIAEDTTPQSDVGKFWISFRNWAVKPFPNLMTVSPVCRAIRDYLQNYMQTHPEPPPALELLRLFPHTPADNQDQNRYAYCFGTPGQAYISARLPPLTNTLIRLDTLDVPVLYELLKRLEGDNANNYEYRDQLIRRLRYVWRDYVQVPVIMQAPVSRRICRRSPRATVEKWGGERGLTPGYMRHLSRSRLCNAMHGDGASNSNSNGDDGSDSNGNSPYFLTWPGQNSPRLDGNNGRGLGSPRVFSPGMYNDTLFQGSPRISDNSLNRMRFFPGLYNENLRSGQNSPRISDNSLNRLRSIPELNSSRAFSPGMYNDNRRLSLQVQVPRNSRLANPAYYVSTPSTSGQANSSNRSPPHRIIQNSPVNAFNRGSSGV
jgi:hypothetical protein